MHVREPEVREGDRRGPQPLFGALDAVVAGALAPLLVHALSDGRRSAVVCPAPRQPGASDRPGHPRLAAQASDKLMDYVESFTRAPFAVWAPGPAPPLRVCARFGGCF